MTVLREMRNDDQNIEIERHSISKLAIPAAKLAISSVVVERGGWVGRGWGGSRERESKKKKTSYK